MLRRCTLNPAPLQLLLKCYISLPVGLAALVEVSAHHRSHDTALAVLPGHGMSGREQKCLYNMLA